MISIKNKFDKSRSFKIVTSIFDLNNFQIKEHKITLFNSKSWKLNVAWNYKWSLRLIWNGFGH